MSATTHLLIHRYRPGTGPQPGTPELDAEMGQWEVLDRRLTDAGALTGAYALHDRGSVLAGDTVSDLGTESEIVFAAHAVNVDSDEAAADLARQMPHLPYGSVEVRPVMA